MTVTAVGAGDALAFKSYPPRSAVISWIFFDWAAQPYFTLITTFVFAPCFATHVARDAARVAGG
jgi:UMF1 family MFS transporter